MICLYSPKETDFSGNGLGALQPLSASVHEIAGGSYEAEVVLPMTLEGGALWRQVVEGSLMRIPTPESSLPAVELYGGGTQYTVNAGGCRVFSKPRTTSKVKKRLAAGTSLRVVRTLQGGSASDPIKANYQDYTLTSKRTKRKDPDTGAETWTNWSTMTGEITFRFTLPENATGISATYTSTVKKAAGGQDFQIRVQGGTATAYRQSTGAVTYTLPSGAITGSSASVTLEVIYTATEGKKGTHFASCKEFDSNVLTITCSGGKSFAQIITNDGVTGWVLLSAITSTGSAGSSTAPVTSQLFRAYEVTKNTGNRTVSVRLRHKSYDHTGSILGRCKVKRLAAGTVLQQIRDAIMIDDEELAFGTNLTGKVTADYSYKSVLQALLEPGKGVVPKRKARLFRDNDTIYLLRKSSIDRGYRIQYGKNLQGVTWTISDENVITRIVPLGKNKDNQPITLKDIDPSANPWVSVEDAGVANESDYPVVRMATIDVDDATEVEEQTNDKGEVTQEGHTLEQCQEEMEDAAAEEFENGCHLSDFRLEVDFTDLGNTVEYAQYKNLHELHLYDLVGIIHGPYGMKTTGQVAEYEYDAIAGCYTRIVIGNVYAVQGATVAGWQLAGGSIDGTKIAYGAITGGHIQDLSIGNAQIGNAVIDNAKIGSAAITYAKIEQASIDRLTAGVIEATEAYIQTLVAGAASIDELKTRMLNAVEAHIETAYADEVDATVIRGQVATIVQAHIDEVGAGNVTAEQLATWTASAAEAVVGELDVDIAIADQIQTNVLSAIAADVGSIKAFNADVSTLNASVANIADARIGTATIGWAQIETLSSGKLFSAEIQGEKMFIERLAVTSAQMVDLTVGQLCVKANDGNYYTLDVDIETGAVTATQTAVSQEEIDAGKTNSGKHLIESSITAEELQVASASLQEALINKLTAARIDVDTLFARQAFINNLNATDITGNNSLRIALDEKASTEQVNTEIALLRDEGIQATVQGIMQDAMGMDDDAIAAAIQEEDPEADVSTIDLKSVMQVLLGQINSRVTAEQAGQLIAGSTLSQTVDGLSLEIEQLIGSATGDPSTVNALTTLISSFRLESEGLVIRNSGSTWNVLLANDGLHLRNGEIDAAYFQYSDLLGQTVMKIAIGQIVNQLNIGHLRWNVQENGSVVVDYNPNWASI